MFDESALASSLYRAGRAYYEGRGVSRDYGISVRLLRDSLEGVSLPGEERGLPGGSWRGPATGRRSWATLGAFSTWRCATAADRG